MHNNQTDKKNAAKRLLLPILPITSNDSSNVQPAHFMFEESFLLFNIQWSFPFFPAFWNQHFFCFFFNKPWRIFRNSAVELKLQFMKLLAFYSDLQSRGILFINLSDSLFNGNCKNLYNFCHIDFIGMKSGGFFFIITFSFWENLFCTHRFNFQLNFCFWFFFCFYIDCISFIVSIWNPTATSNFNQ